MGDGEERIDIDLLRMRLEAGARRYAALAAEHAEVVRRVQRVLELLDPQSLLVRAFQQQTGGNGDGLIASLDLLIDRLESMANPQALLARPGGGGGSESSGEGEATVVKAAATTDRAPGGDVRLTDAQQQFIRLVGEGHLVLVEIAEQMGIPRSRVYEIASQLGPFLAAADVEIPASPTARRAGIAGRNRVVRLSPAGANLYRQIFCEEPVDVWGDLEGRYKSISAAFFIRGVADLIRGLNDLEERTFNFTVVDPAVASDEEIAEIGGRREYVSPSGDAVAQPDLLVRMQPVKGGADTLAVVEVEFGNYSAERLRDKWRRALLCYPPLTLYVIAPNQVVRDRLFREMEETRKQMLASGHIFDRWARYIFYTVDEIARNGLLSPNQIVRQEMARKQGEANVFLPRYFFQKPVRGADDE